MIFAAVVKAEEEIEKRESEILDKEATARENGESSAAAAAETSTRAILDARR